VVTFDGKTDGDWVIGLDDLAKLGDAYLTEHPGIVEQTAKAIPPDALATLIYTSGTTGRPKGVRLLHRSWVYEGTAIQVQNILDESDLQFLWLPMAHSFGKVLLSAQLACGFATAIDGRVDKIVENLGVVKPTFMGAAPRIFEKAHGRIVTMQATEGGLKEKIFLKAFEVGTKVDRLKREGKSVPALLNLQHGLFDKLVFSKVRERFGGRVRFFISGSAALNAEIAEWFHAAGILILEGYGMTENAAGATVNHPDDYKIGTVGPALPGAEVKIGENDEVMLRGPHIMAGYHNLPEETAATLTEDGWLHTGDKGSLDADGFLTITGRIKDLFKTSGGKYVAPPAIESKFKAICPYVSQFLVFGSERNFVVALVTLDPDAMAGWAEENGMSGSSYTDIVKSDAVHKMVGDYIEELNGRLNRWETIKKWEILDHDLTIESGELTPSMKVKRNVVEGNNKSLIDSFYS
jgi:long-chain acyl-CoA synthetase